MREPLILPSAHKHGVTDDDMLHATRNTVDAFAQDDEMTMLIGPDQAGRLLEVGLIQSDHGPVIVHAMPTRKKYHRR